MTVICIYICNNGSYIYIYVCVYNNGNIYIYIDIYVCVCVCVCVCVITVAVLIQKIQECRRLIRFFSSVPTATSWKEFVRYAFIVNFKRFHFVLSYWLATSRVDLVSILKVSNWPRSCQTTLHTCCQGNYNKILICITTWKLVRVVGHKTLVRED